MNSDEFLTQIKTHADQYSIWIEPINRLRKSFVPKKYLSYNDLKHMELAVDEAEAKQKAAHDLPSKIFDFIDENYVDYLGFTQDECETIIASFYGNLDFEILLFRYTNRAIEELELTGEKVWFLRGLVSSSLENCGLDYRDFFGALSDLFQSAKKHGVNPIDSFRQVAAISSRDKPRGYKTSVSKIMMDYVHDVEYRDKYRPTKG
ncbi:MAG: hypothetical protein HN855_12520 [Anaerolineae bacterium]|jgi:hypothetical protein|nr:hypothetical protein [Anaerolineae bacterium]MBT7069306.1 hypothetical protein [Anaerolineae bacterium]MBT7325978.1 hypothetical protein [Anaerolineae bacterium]